MEAHAIKARVSGRVQGVWYRRSTQERARQSGVTGYAINLADGRVEVLLCGAREDVEAVAAWLWQGPPNAEVTSVESEEIALAQGEAPDDFITG
ncbi:acylphosphatase [Halomonas sp. SL1]|uniref:acylphosphatase n=1 Tax=Halomonas sp. SL1 TaxID=2137478 RepID=UPI000D15198A|nr:acylphosphatase [Halomonas sp. SL1]RAH36662.1 acylphosphatase [Halomonas sp. SL1]